VAVHRYKANESADSDEHVKASVTPVKKAAKSAAKTATKKGERAEKKPLKALAPFRAVKDYFVGSWKELRLVRWPNRKQTWAMTLAVILFSLLLGVLIFLLDAGFTLLFKKFVF
jgi:preprotein translocase SecE subunit